MMSREFHLFPLLDEYLRRMVWKFYFLDPDLRVHVIQEPGSNAEAADVIRLTWTTFDAESKIQVPSYLHRDINRESRQVALSLKLRRTLIGRILEPIDAGSVLHEAWLGEPTIPIDSPLGKVAPVNVDWENDWFYLYIPISRWASVSGDWVAKIQKLALPDIPKSEAPEGYSPVILNPEILKLLGDFLNRCPSVKEISVVACDDIPMFAGTDSYGKDGKWCKHLQRDGSRFASWADCIRVNDQVELPSVYQGSHFFCTRTLPLERKVELVVRGRGEFADLPKPNVVNGEESGGSRS